MKKILILLMTMTMKSYANPIVKCEITGTILDVEKQKFTRLNETFSHEIPKYDDMEGYGEKQKEMNRRAYVTNQFSIGVSPIINFQKGAPFEVLYVVEIKDLDSKNSFIDLDAYPIGKPFFTIFKSLEKSKKKTKYRLALACEIKNL